MTTQSPAIQPDTHHPFIKLAVLQTYPGIWSSVPAIIRFQLQLILKQVPTDPVAAKQTLDIMKLSFQMDPTYLTKVKTWTLEEYIKSTTTQTSEEDTTTTEPKTPSTTT